MQAIRKKRLIGVDAARGIALLGMMAIHILPEYDKNYQPTLIWNIFAGAAAGLFALLAGVSLTFSSGGTRPISGRKLTAARGSLAVRALIIALIGLLIAYLNPPAAIILAYYGMMFLLAIPLLGLKARPLACLAVVFAVAGPILMQALRDNLPSLNGYDPTLSDIFTQPGSVLSALLFTGSYPAVPWMAYICAGLAIGRLDLRSQAVQIRLVMVGVFTAVVTWLGSMLLLGPLGGLQHITDASRRMSASDIHDMLIWGPDTGIPTTTGWWLTIMAPYSTTPFELLHTIGTAAAALGVMLLLATRIGSLLTPLAVAGAMTLTLYSTHLVILATGFLEDDPWLDFAIQAVTLVLAAVIWRNTTNGQGPLERMVSAAVTRVRVRILAAPGGPRPAADTQPAPAQAQSDAQPAPAQAQPAAQVTSAASRQDGRPLK